MKARSPVSTAAIVALATALFAGCTHRYVPVGPVPEVGGLEAETYGGLQYFASEYLGCPKDKLAYEHIVDNRHLMKGCDKEVEYLHLSGPDAKAFGYKHFFVRSPTKRAAFELGCEPSELTLHRIDHDTLGVAGCGHRLTYMLACRPICTWVLNSDSKRE